jgi:hypothetical protein
MLTVIERLVICNRLCGSVHNYQHPQLQFHVLSLVDRLVEQDYKSQHMTK